MPAIGTAPPPACSVKPQHANRHFSLPAHHPLGLVAIARGQAPDPIPNSAVKTLRAHGTAAQAAEESVAARPNHPSTLSFYPYSCHPEVGCHGSEAYVPAIDRVTTSTPAILFAARPQ